jgi:IS5 family transposase
MRRELRKLRTWLGRLIRDVRRKAGEPDEDLAEALNKAERLRRQQPQDAHKLYSWHEPEVQCICKGKARQRYEFGQKVALATTNRGNWIVAAKLLPNNPYDGHTLAATLAMAESIGGVPITDAYVDKGYRGHGVGDGANAGGGTRVHIAGSSSRGLPRSERRRRRRRTAIEPKIGHLKSDHRVDRCFLKGLEGDAINIVLAAAGSNFRKLLGRLFFAPCAGLLDWLRGLLAWLPRPLGLASARRATAVAA